MQILVEPVPTFPSATIIRVQGFIDGSNYDQLIAEAEQVHRAGSNRIILDLSGCPYLSSGGLIALQRIVDLLQAKPTVEPEEGWAAIRALRRQSERNRQWNLLLLSPAARVVQVLDMAGFQGYLPVFTDIPSAVASLSEHA